MTRSSKFTTFIGCRVNVSSMHQITTVAHSRQRHMWLSVVLALASQIQNSPLQISNGVTLGTSTSGLSSARPSTIHPSCSSTKRAVTAMYMIISRSRAITEMSWLAPSTTAQGLHWRLDASMCVCLFRITWNPHVILIYKVVS